MIRWLAQTASIAVGVWAGLHLYYFTQEWLACMPLPKLWR